MTKPGRRKFPLILIGVFILLFAGLWLYEWIGDDQTYKGITNGDRINRIEFNSILDSSKHLVVSNDTILKEINQAFHYFQEYSPRNPKMHTVYIQMEIYKKEKLKLELLKTKYSGWAVPIFTKWYQNDSLIGVLDRYSILDSLQ